MPKPVKARRVVKVTVADRDGVVLDMVELDLPADCTRLEVREYYPRGGSHRDCVSEELNLGKWKGDGT